MEQLVVKWRCGLASERVQSTQRLGACGGRLPRRDENRNRIERQDSLRLVALDWPATARPLAPRQLRGRAYSLFGTPNVAIPAIYGEGDCAVGRVLEHILTGSGDVACTGSAGGYNSCLPTDLTVYNLLVPLHIPAPIETAEMDSMVATLRSSLPDLSLAVLLHNRLNELPLPYLSASRLRLPGIVFRLTEFIHTSEPDPVPNPRVYHATTSTFWEMEIKTR